MKVALSGSALIAALASGILGAEAHASPNTHLFSKRGVPAATAKSILKRGSQTIVSDQPDNIAEGTATADEGCTQWVQPVDGDSCYSTIALSEGLSLEDFFSLNPSLEKECQALQTSLFYCIDTDDEHSDETCSKDKSKDDSQSASSSDAEFKEVKVNQKVKATSSAHSSQASQTWAPEPAATSTSTGSNDSQSSSDSSSGGGLIAGVSGLLQMNDDKCGAAGSTADTTATSGPNGNIEFLNCGIDGAGWTPPALHIDMVKYKGLDEVKDTPLFANCKPYIEAFNSYGEQYNIPPIFLASISMQESSCQPDVTGGGGEVGLMQITHDKCGDAPNGDCHDPSYNIGAGAKYLRDRLDNFSGNVLQALGGYNGWSADMTYSAATAAANSGCCKCQNNLDYLHSTLNCIAQGLASSNCKHYANLDVCS